MGHGAQVASLLRRIDYSKVADYCRRARPDWVCALALPARPRATYHHR